MSAIYRIKSDLDRFMACGFDDMDLLEKMPDFAIRALGTPLPFKWTPPEAEFLTSDNGSEVRPDIIKWSANVLIMSKSAADSLSSFLTANVVEFYPLAGEGGDYFFTNPIQRLNNDFINLEKTKFSYFDDGSVEAVTNIVFNQSTSTNIPPLFALEIEYGVELYCTETFRKAIEQHEFKGLVFEGVEIG